MGNEYPKFHEERWITVMHGEKEFFNQSFRER